MDELSASVGDPVKQIAELLQDSGSIPDEREQKTEEAKSDNMSEEEVSSDESLNATTEETEGEATGVEDVSDESSDEGDVDTLNNLAEMLETDVKDLYALNVNLSEGDPATLGTLKDFYEANRDIEDLRTGITKREEDLQYEIELAQSAPAISNEVLQARAQVLAIQSQYEATNWELIRQQDPGQYAALQSDFHNQFNLAKDNERVVQESVDTNEDDAKRYQQERLYEAIPQLKEESFRKEAASSVNKLVSKYGFTANDLNNINDHRLMRLLIDVSKMTTASETAKEKLQDKTPTGNKPVAAKHLTSVSGRKSSLKRLTERAKATGDRRDQIAAVSALME